MTVSPTHRTAPLDARRALVVADTHLTASTLDRMPAAVWSLAEQVDVVLHAGDVVDAAVLAAFAERAPVHAVLGNNDRAMANALPDDLELALGGVAVAMVHDAGARTGREARLARRYPDARVVIFGHSHQPVVARSAHGQLLVNPGSPTQRRRQPVHTVALLELAGAQPSAVLVEVGPLAGATRGELPPSGR